MKIRSLFFILLLFIISSGNSQTHKNYCTARLTAESTYISTKALLLSENSKAFRQAETTKPLSESGLPVAIFQGEYDSLINYDYYQNLAIPNLWNQKTTLIRNASHSPHFEAAQEFNRLLIQFISDVNH